MRWAKPPLSNHSWLEAHANLGGALFAQRRVEEAISCYRHAIALKPNLPEFHSDLANALLLLGNFSDGWQEYEWRLRLRETTALRRNFREPLWDGSDLEGRTILLQAEQGFGDTIQFVRYARLVQERGGNVVIECQPELERLLHTIRDDLHVIAKGHGPPVFHVHVPLASLPRLFSTDLASIPNAIPYLHANPRILPERFSASSSPLKVGLVWAGSPSHQNDRNRSLNLQHLEPLARIPNIQFFSLQTGMRAIESKSSPPSMQLTDLTPEFKDFADTAAAIASLDLIITVDTAVAHLAGALGRPVWILLPFVPDWRWGLESEATPWYPTMRLFRQSVPGDWESLIARVVGELAGFAGRYTKPSVGALTRGEVLA